MEKYREGSFIHSLIHRVIELLRWYVRYSPNPVGKLTALRFLWYLRGRLFEQRVVATRRHRAETTFGMVLDCPVLLDFIPGFIYLFGSWEPNLSHWIAQRLKPGDVFIDVGANIGYFTLLASEIVGREGKVVAIEASPTIFKALQANLEINSLKNVRAINKAVLDQKGTVSIHLGPDYNTGLTSIVPGEAGYSAEGVVDAAPLGDLLTPEEIRRVRLIKIDVEGAEWKVVDGMRPLLAQLGPNTEFVIELAPDRKDPSGKTADDVLGVFRDAGFTFQHISNNYDVMSYPATLANPAPPTAFADTTLRHQMDLIASRRPPGG